MRYNFNSNSKYLFCQVHYNLYKIHDISFHKILRKSLNSSYPFDSTYKGRIYVRLDECIYDVKSNVFYDEVLKEAIFL